MKKKFLLLIVLVFVFILCFIIFKCVDRKKNESFANSIYSYLDTISLMKLDDGDYNIIGNRLFNEFVSVDLDFFDKLSDGDLSILDGKVARACLNIDNRMVVVENDELVSNKKGHCEYLILNDEVVTLEEFVEGYLNLVYSTEIVTPGIYSISDLNEYMPFLTEFPSDGWILLDYNDIDGIIILKYSIKYRNKVLTFIDKKEVTDEVFDFSVLGEDDNE